MHETIRVGAMSVTFLMTRHETADALDIFELTMPPATSVVVPHTHRNYDEWVLGLDGITTWTLNGEIVLLHPGESLFIPRGTPHFFANVHDSPGRVICLQTPGVMGPEYYREIAAHFSDAEPDPAGIGAVMSRYGVEPLVIPEQVEEVRFSNRR
ncbi:MAG TPA: cupin domain-containing protein [Edaphobacter sp.]|nr:cupin domain-containing protein [Edaphobacter sp.]